MMSEIAIKVTKEFLPILLLVLVFTGGTELYLEKDIAIAACSILKVILIYMISLTVGACHLAISLNGNSTQDERLKVITFTFSKFFLLIGLLMALMLFTYNYRKGSITFDWITIALISGFISIMIWIYISHVRLTNRIESQSTQSKP